MSLLTPCPECRRHLRKTETQCPFCGEAVSLAHVPEPALPRKRLGRAATFAFGASVIGATSLVACSDGTDQGANQAVYGAPPGGSSSAGNNNADAGAGTPVYGAPAAGSGTLGGNGGVAGSGVSGAGGSSGNGGAAGEAGAQTEGGNGGDGGDGGDGGETSAAALYGGPPSGTGGV